MKVSIVLLFIFVLLSSETLHKSMSLSPPLLPGPNSVSAYTSTAVVVAIVSAATAAVFAINLGLILCKYRLLRRQKSGVFLGGKVRKIQKYQFEDKQGAFLRALIIASAVAASSQ